MLKWLTSIIGIYIKFLLSVVQGMFLLLLSRSCSDHFLQQRTSGTSLSHYFVISCIHTRQQTWLRHYHDQLTCSFPYCVVIDWLTWDSRLRYITIWSVGLCAFGKCFHSDYRLCTKTISVIHKCGSIIYIYSHNVWWIVCANIAVLAIRPV